MTLFFLMNTIGYILINIWVNYHFGSKIRTRIITFLSNNFTNASKSTVFPFFLFMCHSPSFSLPFLPLSFPFNQKIFSNQSTLVHFHIVHCRDQGTGTISYGGTSRALKVKVLCWRRQWQLSALEFISTGVSHLRFTPAPPAASSHPALKSLPLSLFIRIHYC